MRVSENIKSCLGFLITKSNVSKKIAPRYEGTAFFVTVPSETYPTDKYCYLVTAKHVVFDDNGKPLGNMWLRLNTVDGRRDDIRLTGEWIPSENKDVDVAVMSIEPPSEDYYQWRELPYLPPEQRSEGAFNSFADEAIIDEWRIGIGDELIVAGLFSERTGNKRNIPVVRSGIIAAMPEEPLELEMIRNGEKVKVTFNAYLAELRSIGGLSGSPVFVTMERMRKKQKVFYLSMNSLIDSLNYTSFLLGMIRGHWDYEKQKSFIGLVGKDVEQVNLGMAYVTPIQDVIDVLYGDKMKEQRKRDNG